MVSEINLVSWFSIRFSASDSLANTSPTDAKTLASMRPHKAASFQLHRPYCQIVACGKRNAILHDLCYWPNLCPAFAGLELCLPRMLKLGLGFGQAVLSHDDCAANRPSPLVLTDALFSMPFIRLHNAGPGQHPEYNVKQIKEIFHVTQPQASRWFHQNTFWKQAN